ncbi:MAG: Holliday junction branch migration protein RuvA [Calditrichia bacterium]|nr:Holliday junction branch migration protein RuvA [Calditrichia bacterium]
MIDYVTGKIEQKTPTAIVVDVNGIGYHISTSVQTYEKIPGVGEQVKIKTYLHVREDILQLYGFADEKERSVFLGLISISGVGPKQAQSILSGIPIIELVQAISEADVNRLTTISGVGNKTAQRLIIELKEKFKSLGLIDESSEMTVQLSSLEHEAIMALVSLGYRKQTAEKAIIKIRGKEKVLSVEEMIKKVLQMI